ncbi:CAP domain-containing protein [Kitasatospora sp. GP82]|uniref:CAP domain-containing protein n=1 Tax=Kitasatospora sp. GP82 TaxID=3035089 RepID=UPI002475163F|nr:CAP domain-containing protein [Kitasatospora sp. GP82]MDH6126373.1 uncharacterized protein YkwD [Kitasatospora sp. GP82]
MPSSSTGRHRRPRRKYAPRLAATAGVAGAGLMLPLVSASGASAAPGAHSYGSHAQWREHHWDHQHHHQDDSHEVTPAGASHAPSSPSASATHAHAPAPTRPAAGSHSAHPVATPTRASSPSAAPSHAPAPSHASAPAPAPAPAPATAQPSSDSDAVQQVLALINQARAAQGLPAYTITTGLTHSAEAHNQLMAGGCGMSHQCPGEAELGDRETAQGIQWNAVGENIGEGGPVASATQDIASMAVSLTQDMLNETPPDDGHRKNILSSEFTHIGIAVHRDSQGTVWLTQDFSN